MKFFRKLKAHIRKFRTGKCGTDLYYEGCGCIDCQKLQLMNLENFHEYIEKMIKDDI